MSQKVLSLNFPLTTSKLTAGRQEAIAQNVKEGPFKMQCSLYIIVLSPITNNRTINSSKNYISKKKKLHFNVL